MKSDLPIVQALAPRVGLRDVVQRDGARLEAPHHARPPRAARHRARRPRARTGAHPDGAHVALFGDKRMLTATGRVNLVHTLPPADEPATPDFPMLLLSLSTERSHASQWVRESDDTCELTVHPSSSAGIAAGARARLVSRASSIIVRVKHDGTQRRDVALLPKGGHLRRGHAANALVRAVATQLGEGGALYDERVRREPIA